MDDDDVAKSDGISGTGLTDDIFNKRLPDDCVEYIILVIDDKIKTELELRERLRAVQNAENDFKKTLLRDYIWQRDQFELKLERGAKSSRSDHQTPSSLSYSLQGSTNFGDSIADEWLIVFLLRRLSEEFSDIWVRASDADGEFLLVEAANALPKWLNPEIADNRVWINDGKLKIIPLADESNAGQSSNLTLERAVAEIRLKPSSLIHSQSIEDEAFFRIRNYPKEIKSTLHNALVRIPRRLAHILHQSPAYISAAVESFYIRDPISLKPLTTKDTGTMFFPPEDFVNVSVKFTRVGFAQLQSQEFQPPPSWTAILPHLGDRKVTAGLKVTCGFEMLLHEKANQDSKVVREVKLLLSEVDSGEEALPDDSAIAKWSQVEDDDKWLDISFEDLDSELKGSQAKRSAKGGFGDQAAQENLQKMVSRFESFLADEKAGIDGVDEEHESDTESSASDSDGEDKEASFNDQEFEQAMREMMGMPPEEKEQQGLVEEARRLALEMEDSDEGERDEEEETRKVMELMEQELRGHGALDLRDLQSRAETPGQAHLMRGKGKKVQDVHVKGDDEDKELGELSSDDDNEDNDIDVDLLRNILESFKGQAGMAGPASNMLASMGIRMPRDEGEQIQDGKGKTGKHVLS